MMEIGAELIRMLLEPRLYYGVPILFAEFSRSAAATLLTALWQGLVIAAFLGLCLRFAPRVSAGLRFVVMAGGFVAIMALPFLPMIWSVTRRTETAVGAANPASAAHPLLLVDVRWSIALTLAWLAASLWRAVDLTVHSVRLRRLWKSATPVEHLNVTLPKLRGRKAVELCATNELERPSVIGFFAPRILIPAWLLDRLSEAELDQIVLHESEHLRRGDDWTNLLQKLSLVVFPLNPALLWMERRLCLEREMACDEGVVRRTHAPRAYAACLASLAEHGLERRVQALSLGAWQRRPELARRVHSLLAKKPVLKPAAAAGMAALLGCGIMAGSAELSRCPQMIGFSAPDVAAQKAMPRKEGLTETANADFEGDRVLRPERKVAAMAMPGETPHMTQLRATMPMTPRDGSQEMRHAARLRELDIRTPAQRYYSAPTKLQGEPLNAEAKNASLQLNPEERQTQGWVVMTTMWEQSEPASAATISDMASEESGDSAAKEPTPGAAHITVTRLVWRVPAAGGEASPSDNTAQTAKQAAQQQPAQTLPAMPPAIVPVRGGWLIIRL